MGLEAGMFGSAVLLSGIMFGSSVVWAGAGSEGVGDTRIASWRDDKVAAFLLMFDDGIPSHLDNVIPELHKRGYVGTFYLNPGVGWYQQRRKEWETDALAAGMVLANHTMLHKGAKNAAEAETEIAACNEYLLRILPNPGKPRLLSYCTPGGTEWHVTSQEMEKLYAKYHLVPRPSSAGRFGGIHLKTAGELLHVVDLAVAKTNGFECLFFHGVGGDWLKQSKEDFVAMLDHLDTVKDRLWVTDPISMHQYETERNAAKMKVLSSGEREIHLQLEVPVDLQFYNLPLTLVTRVPATWRACQIRQHGRVMHATADGGLLRYDAAPDGGEIAISVE